MLGRRRLNKNTVNSRIAVQLLQRAPAIHSAWLKRAAPVSVSATQVRGTFCLSNAHKRAKPDHLPREPRQDWRYAFCFQFCDITAEISVNFFRDSAAINKLCHRKHAILPASTCHASALCCSRVPVGCARHASVPRLP
jgi:hypothetical protein